MQVVNLLVTPEQAEVLSLASNQTHIQLVLRNPLDTQTVQPPGTMLANLFKDPNAPQAKARRPRAKSLPPPPSRVYLVEVLRIEEDRRKIYPG